MFQEHRLKTQIKQSDPDVKKLGAIITTCAPHPLEGDCNQKSAHPQMSTIPHSHPCFHSYQSSLRMQPVVTTIKPPKPSRHVGANALPPANKPRENSSYQAGPYHIPYTVPLSLSLAPRLRLLSSQLRSLSFLASFLPSFPSPPDQSRFQSLWSRRIEQTNSIPESSFGCESRTRRRTSSQVKTVSGWIRQAKRAIDVNTHVAN